MFITSSIQWYSIIRYDSIVTHLNLSMQCRLTATSIRHRQRVHVPLCSCPSPPPRHLGPVRPPLAQTLTTAVAVGNTTRCPKKSDHAIHFANYLLHILSALNNTFYTNTHCIHLESVYQFSSKCKFPFPVYKIFILKWLSKIALFQYRKPQLDNDVTKNFAISTAIPFWFN
jgi:hypothetical protein